VSVVAASPATRSHRSGCRANRSAIAKGRDPVVVAAVDQAEVVVQQANAGEQPAQPVAGERSAHEVARQDRNAAAGEHRAMVRGEAAEPLHAGERQVAAAGRVAPVLEQR
jgi:hypothetical protein